MGDAGLGHRHRGSACTRTVQHNAVRVHVLQRKVLVCGCPEGCHVTQQRQSAPTRRKLNAGQMRHVQADRISCFNRHWAEYAGYWESTSFFEEEGREERRKPGTTIFYDSVTSEPLFQAPVGRYLSVFAFLSLHVLLCLSACVLCAPVNAGPLCGIKLRGVSGCLCCTRTHWPPHHPAGAGRISYTSR